jgi:hypothetical protein
MPIVDPSRIEEHMPVLSADGQRVGTMDWAEDGRISLTWCGEGGGGGRRCYLPLDAVASCEGGQVRLAISAEEARRQALREERGRDPAPAMGR